MVDRIARDKYAQVLRHFAAGNLTNDEYEDATDEIVKVCDAQDRAVEAIYSAAWFTYDDLRTYRLRGKWAMSDENRRVIARWVLFLHSDLEYEWPMSSMISLSGCLLRICTLGLADRVFGPSYERRMRRLGSWDLWPFYRESDDERAKANPRLLGGTGTNHSR